MGRRGGEGRGEGREEGREKKGEGGAARRENVRSRDNGDRTI